MYGDARQKATDPAAITVIPRKNDHHTDIGQCGKKIGATLVATTATFFYPEMATGLPKSDALLAIGGPQMPLSRVRVNETAHIMTTHKAATTAGQYRDLLLQGRFGTANSKVRYGSVRTFLTANKLITGPSQRLPTGDTMGKCETRETACKNPLTDKTTIIIKPVVGKIPVLESEANAFLQNLPVEHRSGLKIGHRPTYYSFRELILESHPVSRHSTRDGSQGGLLESEEGSSEGGVVNERGPMDEAVVGTQRPSLMLVMKARKMVPGAYKGSSGDRRKEYASYKFAGKTVDCDELKERGTLPLF
ncbi:uncharacterized protein BT62DRAFT_1007141 [Guyanagaster necrorhizus]|uniref:Uncharacterized protein n=1 Tax=Guyanagaster necrorhizus TaxID=856835 RepID=A0A9P7VR67_9AGAR|nr:uncharacterized protein BT62DRAFT_1007141 [Guyanagaster necrorhizus MCA 3950]KAG7445404.1 hypothetical protein BT62DRAFT_1007141 [Guyanagaster necrorhizus MCA 3950]